MNSLKSIIRADYLQRTRSYGFLITMLVSICLAYTFIPPAGAHYATVVIGDYAGENNAAWIGSVTAIMASTFLWLFGFYLVNNGIRRDKETGVGQIVATTSISNFKYLLAKALSNFFVLFTIMLIIMIMALVLVVLRGRDYPFDVIQFFSPYLVSTIPALLFVSALAVFAEVVLGNHSNLQNVIFFFVFIAIVMFTNTSTDPGLHWMDVLGTKVLTDGMAEVVNTQYSHTVQHTSVGFTLGTEGHMKYFLFRGTWLPAGYILSRLAWTGMAFLLLIISARLFRRFDVKERLTLKRRFTFSGGNKQAISGESYGTSDFTEAKTPLKEIHLGSLPVANPSYGILPFVKIELLMLFRKGPRWFWIINLGGFIALWLMPLTAAHQVGLPVMWFLQINRWADIATKEKYNRTHYFTYAAYKPLQRLLSSQVIAGIVLAMALAFPLIFRYSVSGDLSAVAGIVSGAIFLISLSVFMGILSGGSRIFEILFFLLTYANINGAKELDYFGAFNRGFLYLAVITAISLILLTGAFLSRNYEITHQ